MPFNIIIDHATTDRGENSSHSSFSDDEEDSSGTGVHLSPHSPRSVSGSHEYEDREGSWDEVVYPDDIGPSDSASRPRTSDRQRPIVEAPQPEEARRPTYRRQITHERERIRNAHPPRVHRSPPSTDAESVDPDENWQGYAHGPPHQYGRAYAQYAAPGYQAAQYQTFPPQAMIPAGQQQVAPFAFSPYQHAPALSYFGQGHHAGGHAFPPPGAMPYSPNAGFYPYAPQGFPMPQAMPPTAVFAYPPQLPSPPAVHSPPASSASSKDKEAAKDTSKDDEKFARLEKLILDEKEERAAKEAAAEKAAAEKKAKAEADAAKAEEIKVASDAAAAAAKKEAEDKHKAEKDAADKKAKEAEKNKKPPAPKEKQKPIKFKDAVGRKFSFPFHLCNTWQGMEYLIKEAFVHVEGIGGHVAEGHYDLLGPQGEIILPHVWETVVEPDWAITMHMWPMAEEKPDDALADALADIVAIEDEGVPPPPPPAPSGGKKGKKKQTQPLPGLFSWAAGGKQKSKKSGKGKKK